MNLGYTSEQVKSEVMATGLSAESQMKHIFAAGFSFLVGFLVQIAGLGTGILAVSLLALFLYPLVRISGKKKLHEARTLH